MTRDRLVITASPHLKGKDSTPRIMWNVVGSLVPVVLAAAWYFGVSALLVIAAAVAGCVAAERAFGKASTLRDGSAAITGLLLGLCLPAGMPMWMAALGGFVGIALGKSIFGGLGQNVFNPALIGRAFLQAAFPVPITTWQAVGGSFWTLRGDTFALPFMRANAPDALTAATPLGSWSSEEKFAAVVETASLTELEVSAFCRHKGIYPEQLGTWRETCRQANTALPSKAERAERRAEREEVQRLTRELAYKDRALAEAAALLVLQKKVRQIWEESEAAPSPRNGASR